MKSIKSIWSALQSLPFWLRSVSIVTLVITLISFAAFFYYEHDPKLRASLISVGIASAGVVGLFQLLVFADEVQLKGRLEKLQIVDFVRERGHDLDQIAPLIEAATRRVFIIGGNAKPVLERSVAIYKIGEPRKTILEDAVCRGVQVRVLIASKDKQNPKTKQGYEIAREKLDELTALAARLNENNGRQGDFKAFEFRHEANHYLIVADNDVVCGATFPICVCPNEPALHMKSASPIARSYIKHFVDEWRAVGGNIEDLEITPSERPV